MVLEKSSQQNDASTKAYNAEIPQVYDVNSTKYSLAQASEFSWPMFWIAHFRMIYISSPKMDGREINDSIKMWYGIYAKGNAFPVILVTQ